MLANTFIRGFHGKSGAAWRTSFLALLILALTIIVGPDLASASDFNRFRVAQLVVESDRPAAPDAAFVLAQEVRFRTAVDARLERVIVPLSSQRVFDHPFLIWVATSAFREFSDLERAHLATFLSNGGFLLIDTSLTGQALAAFHRRIETELARIVPSKRLMEIDRGHVLFRSFYKLQSVAGRRNRSAYLEGMIVDGRVALVLSINDLVGAWDRDGFGQWRYECVPGGPQQRESAIRLGINLVMYALLGDYKDEQAHVEYLLKRRRLSPSDLPTKERD